VLGECILKGCADETTCRALFSGWTGSVESRRGSLAFRGCGGLSDEIGKNEISSLSNIN
jgi:hypothetical protein